jgi:SAM-dependent methyltransferase
VKNVWKYISYFFYVAINWTPWLAFFVLYHDIRGAIKYGISTFIPVALNKLTIVNGDTSKASPYEAANYYLLEKLFTAFRKLSNADSFIDLGCGKGRVLAVASHFGFHHITGIDFATELCKEASANMEKVKKKLPDLKWKVVNDNVANYNISPGDSVFFMFNPFNEAVLKDFLKNIDSSCHQFPRTTYFIYASPLHQQLLLDNGYAIVYQKQKMNLKGIIAKRD